MVLKVESGEAYTLDELSRRVFDPFPAPVSVVLPAAPDEVEGFVVASDGRLHVPTLGLGTPSPAWPATWVAPDPVVSMVEHSLAAARHRVPPGGVPGAAPLVRTDPAGAPRHRHRPAPRAHPRAALPRPLGHRPTIGGAPLRVERAAGLRAVARGCDRPGGATLDAHQP